MGIVVVDLRSEPIRFRFREHHRGGSQPLGGNQVVVTPTVGCRHHHVVRDVVHHVEPVFQALGVGVEQSVLVGPCHHSPRFHVGTIEEIASNVNPADAEIVGHADAQQVSHHGRVPRLSPQQVKVVLASIVDVGILSLLRCRETPKLIIGTVHNPPLPILANNGFREARFCKRARIARQQIE